MRLLKFLAAAAAVIGGADAWAQDTFMHVYTTDSTAITTKNPYTGQDVITGYVGSFTSAPLQNLDSITMMTNKGEISRLKITYTTDGKTHAPKPLLSSIKRISFGPNPAEFRITIPDSMQLTDVKSKTEYLEGQLQVSGFGVYEDFEGTVKVRGRGNSTWNMPKKAYRLKLPEKTKLLGYRKAKNYVLLANYIDLSMMRNEVAALATQLVGMPYPTHAKPVNVYFNNKYKGSYQLMEKVGINNGSVNIPAAQEAESIMFELDVNYDEELKTVTPHYNLPLLHKDPDAPTDPAEAKEWFGNWANDFIEMEKAVAEGKNIGDYVDYETLAKFLVVFNIACNQEINHPKSIYLYKTRGGKWNFGPCWDFDWAYGYQPTYRTESSNTVSQEEGERLLREIKEFAESRMGPFGGYTYFYYQGEMYLWTDENTFYKYTENGFVPYPWGVTTFLPTYNGYLLGTGKNTGTTSSDHYNRVGNGGEFFLSMIMDNPEFIGVYKQVWESFYGQLDAFWEAFDAYAAELEPTAEKNHTIWSYSYTSATDSELAPLTDGTYSGAIRALRHWLELRIEFINNPDNNYGLYNPSTTYRRGELSTKK